MECPPDLTFTATNLPPLLCNYMPRAAAEAVGRPHALLHHRICQGKQWPRVLRGGSGLLCSWHCSSVFSPGSSGTPALLVPPPLASRGETGSSPFPESLCWYCKLQPPQARGQQSDERKSCPDWEQAGGYHWWVCLAPSDCAWMC